MAQNINKDAAYRAAKPKDKDYTINDGGGLYMLIKTIGSKLWHFVYTIEGKRKKLAFGIYPSITLDAARRKAQEARAQIANGTAPSETKKQSKQSTQADTENAKRKAAGLPIIPIINSFEHSARDWLAFPILGDMFINEIKSADVLRTLKSRASAYKLNKISMAYVFNSSDAHH